MKINRKVTVMSSILLILLITGAWAGSYHYVIGNIKTQEQKEVYEDIERVQYLITDNKESLNILSSQYSAWDDTLKFVDNISEDYIKSNLNDATLESANLHLFAIIDNFDKLKYIKIYDPKLKKEIKIPEDVTFFLENNKKNLSQFMNVYGVGSAVISVDGRPMIISFRPITNSTYDAPIEGTLIMGRYIEDSFINKMEQIVNAKIIMDKIISTNSFETIAGNNSKIKIPYNKSYQIEVNDINNITGYYIIKGYDNKPLFIVGLHEKRTDFNEGIRAVHLFIFICIIFLVLIIIGVKAFLRLYIIKPIEDISNDVSGIELNDDKISKIKVIGNDEIADLSMEINNMLTRIEYSNKKIQDSEKQLKLVLEGAGAGFWDWDIEKDYLYFNEKFLEILGYSEDELPNSSKTWRKLIHESDLEYSLKFLQNSLGHSLNMNIIEQRMRTKTGEYKWILNQCKVVRYGKENKPERMTGIITDISDKKIHEEELKYLNYYDRLTGLFNRGYYEYIIDKISSNNNLPISIIIGDLNGLKIANDTFGHSQGDKLLAEAANILKDIAGSDAIISRYGGDEFVVILEETDSAAANELCQAIKYECENRKVGSITVNIALGCSTKENYDQDINDVIKEAEERMYRNKLLEGRSARNNIISSLTKTLSEKSHETEEHAYRIYNLCVEIGKILNFSTDKLDELYLLARLHDIGKIGIDSRILDKPGKLTDEEWEVMKTHSEIGYRIAASTPDLMHIAYGILTHHERYDGTGYPKGLKGEQIPLLSRILSIVDAYDVMTHDRPYKVAMSEEEAIEELEKCSGKQFDPNLVQICIKAFKSE